MKKKHKFLKFLVIAIMIFLLIYVLSYLLYKKKLSDDIKSTVENLGCTFYSTNLSSEKGIDWDIYISIPYQPVENTGVSNQYWYEILIKAVTSKLGDKTYKIIDNEKNITIMAQSKNKVVQYAINGNIRFFETEMAKINKAKRINQKNSSLIIKSKELDTLIKNDWSRAKSKGALGTIEKTDEDYDCYIDEGYFIKSANLKVINIVFNSRYTQEVFDGIKTGMDNSQIREKLGYPLFVNDADRELNGYKTDEYYVFFSNGEISIYPIQESNEQDNEQFASITSELTNSGDIDRFISQLTEIYPNYDEYYKNQNELSIKYSFLGLKIQVDRNKNYRLTIYNNFQGKITQDVSINDIENGRTLPKNMYVNKYDGVFETELERKRIT